MSWKHIPCVFSSLHLFVLIDWFSSMLKKKKNDIFYYYLSFKKIFQTLKSLSFSWSLEESALQASWPGSSFPTQNLGDFSHQLTFWALAVVVVQWLSHV